MDCVNNWGVESFNTDTKMKKTEYIIVKISGKNFKTYIDGHGVQRFLSNKFYNWLDVKYEINGNDLSKAYQTGCFSKWQYAKYLMGLGYSVCGFTEISVFEDWEIENPLWEKKQKKAK